MSDSQKQAFESWFNSFFLGMDQKQALLEVWQAATQAERERCARIADAVHDDEVTWNLSHAAVARHIADAIRQGGAA